MNSCVFIIMLSLLLLLLAITSASHLAAVEGDDSNGVIMNKCLEKERDALIHFKSQLQDPYEILSSWRADDDDCCKWRRVTCSNQTGHITELELNDCGLVGEVSHSLVNLTYLNLLDLSFNSFHGTIPSFIGSLTRLRHLHLSSNSFHGTIPSFIGSLTRLRHLHLSSNSFHGTIPPEFGNLTNLQVLWLQDVGRCRVENLEWLSYLSQLEELLMDGISLAKQNHWVDAILSLSNLSLLTLEGCELSQVMYPYSSSFLNSSSSSIQTLYLGNNTLTSSMYPWLFPLTSNNLIILGLSNNMLHEIPKYLGNLCRLEYLYFDNNAAVINLPDFLTNLSGCTSLSLRELYAPRSQFTGSLSDEIQKFSSLVNFDLSHNQLNGSIGEKLWQLPSLLTLDVSFNNLTLPSTYHLSSLSSLQELSLSSCKLLGPCFPKWIQSLKNLTSLDLSNTGISDTVPLEFWDMWPSQLTYLNLSSNNITGKIPDLLSNFDNHSLIDLSSNRFYGPIPNIPSTLASNFDGPFVLLDLSHNSFIGQLPDCQWRFQQLGVLSLGNNNLSGRLPPSIGSLIELKVLYLYNNNFSGELPLSLKNCTSLYSLNLGANNFTGNVPDWIGENLSGLYVLILRSNNFFGTIPLQSCQLANLQILDLSMNHLHGTIPSCLSNLTSMVQHGFFEDVLSRKFVRGTLGYVWWIYVDHAMIEWQGDEREFFRTLKLVTSIDLSSNNFTGQIPYQITNLSDLIYLNLSKNTLSGEIPQKIGEMKKLLTLDLSRNNLSGRIPASISQMTLLNDLHLSFNNLSGRIPSSTQLQSFQPSTYDGSSQLCGPPLTKICPEDEESKVKPVIGKSEGDGDELWGWFYIGGGMGFATGFWIACGSLLLNRRGRHAFFKFYDNFKDWVYVKMVVFIAKLQKARQN